MKTEKFVVLFRLRFLREERSVQYNEDLNKTSCLANVTSIEHAF